MHERRRVRLESTTRARRLLRTLALAACWLATTVASAGESFYGMPLLRRFTPADYNASPQQLGLATDRRGHLYVGNLDGVLHYDGEDWELITLPGNAVARDVAVGGDGRIYVASYDSFGVIVVDEAGRRQFRDLVSKAGLERSEVGIVWEILPTTRGVYFRAERELYLVGYDETLAARWPLSESTRSFVAIGDALFARVDGVGFCRFDDGRMIPEPGAEVFADQALAGVIDQGDWRLLVGDQGLHRSDANGIVPLPGGKGREIADSDAFEVLALRDGSFVVGTLGGELFRYDADFSLRERLSLGSYGIVALVADAEGGVWAATEGDLVRLVLPSPWSRFDASTGLLGNAVDFEWYDGGLWIATSRGFMRMRSDADGRAVSEMLDWIDYEAYALAATDAGLLLGHRDGLMVLEPGADTPRVLFEGEQEGLYELEASRRVPGRVYGLSEKGLFVLGLEGGRWTIVSRIDLQPASAGGLVETAANEVWFGDARGGPQRWRFDADGTRTLSRVVFGEKHGLEIDADSGSFLYELDGRVHVVSGARGYIYDGKRFVADKGLPFTLTDRPNELSVVQTPHGAYATTTRHMWFRPTGESAWNEVHPGSELAAGYGAPRLNADGVVRVTTWNGLLQFDPREAAPPLAPLELVFDRVTSTAKDGAERALPLSDKGRRIAVEPGSRLTFRYLLVNMGGDVEYRYRLLGIGEAESEPWSDWTDRELFVRAQTAGAYDLQVQARTHDGRISPTIAYRYRVLPNWHEKGWVRALAAIAALLLFGLAARVLAQWRTRRLTEANRRLEASVAERTSQLQEANQALNESNADLVASREQVIASSRRADLIFKALNDALAGTVLDEHYRIDQRIGSGGFGTVYRATELHMENVVAIKVFKPVPGHDSARSMERFRAEGHSAFLVDHPNAVRVLDFGICVDAVAYLVMEYLNGSSLAEVLAEERILAPWRAVRILRQASDVLAHAHEVGVVHRDVKPHNILLCHGHDEEEVVKLIDFGIAKVLDEATPNQLRNLTATGLLMGTPNYMAPERFLEKDYDGKSDVYSLGVIGYEMLSGTRPFPELGENYLPVALQHVNDAPPPLDTRAHGLAAPLVRFIMDMLAKHPGDRPTAAEAANFFAGLEQSMPADDVVPDRSGVPGATTAVFASTPRKSRSR